MQKCKTSTLFIIYFGILIFNNYIAAVETGTEENEQSNENETLPECVYVNPIQEMERWDEINWTKCRIINFRPPKEEKENSRRYDNGEKYYSYNSYASDLIGPRRDLSNISTHELCRKIEHEIGNLRANIIIIYHNEAFSVLIRMINSIILQTSNQILRRIVVYDDYSDETIRINNALSQYVELQRSKGDSADVSSASYAWSSKVRLHRSKKREGLIRAKAFASRLIYDDGEDHKTEENILIFLDSHCEVTNGWIEPLLAPIHKDPTTVVLPVVDLIGPFKLDYSKAMIARGTFDWGLKFNWEYFDWSYFDNVDNYVLPFSTIVPSGGLLAIKEDFFRKIGEYDTGMEIWGAENVELAVRVWLCGGSILTAPCSRVGHIFRTRRPYSAKPGVDTNIYNSLRTVSVWFDEYKEKFLEFRPSAKRMDPGDLTERLKLKESLACKPFSWFIENIHTSLRVPITKKTKSKPVKPTKPKKTEL